MLAFLKTTGQANPSAKAMMKFLATGLLVCLISACGGGGDSGSTVSKASFPISQVMATQLQSTRTINLSGTVDGVSGQVAYSQSLDAPRFFEGITASASNITLIVTSGGVVRSQQSFTRLFSADPPGFFGTTGADTYVVVNQTALFPISAKVGEIGTVGTETGYTDISKSQVTGSQSITWSLEADSESTALLCINRSGASTGSECYRIDSSGNLLGNVLRLVVDGKAVVFQ